MISSFKTKRITIAEGGNGRVTHMSNKVCGKTRLLSERDKSKYLSLFVSVTLFSILSKELPKQEMLICFTIFF